jgi:ribosomal protein S18 acetylase RimI-like enzyme
VPKGYYGYVTRDEIREIAAIVGGDKTYSHFVHRINKEFEASDEERNSRVYVLFQEDNRGNRVGFCVIGHSPKKMKVWEKVFKEESWVLPEFKIGDPAYELMYMYVQPRLRDKGLGKNLFKKAMAFSKKHGVSAVYAYVSDRNDYALNFYKKMNAKVLEDFSEKGISAAFLEWQI